MKKIISIILIIIILNLLFKKKFNEKFKASIKIKSGYEKVASNKFTNQVCKNGIISGKKYIKHNCGFLKKKKYYVNGKRKQCCPGWFGPDVNKCDGMQIVKDNCLGPCHADGKSCRGAVIYNNKEINVRKKDYAFPVKNVNAKECQIIAQNNGKKFTFESNLRAAPRGCIINSAELISYNDTKVDFSNPRMECGKQGFNCLELSSSMEKNIDEEYVNKDYKGKYRSKDYGIPSQLIDAKKCFRENIRLKKPNQIKIDSWPNKPRGCFIEKNRLYYNNNKSLLNHTKCGNKIKCLDDKSIDLKGSGFPSNLISFEKCKNLADDYEKQIVVISGKKAFETPKGCSISFDNPDKIYFNQIQSFYRIKCGKNGYNCVEPKNVISDSLGIPYLSDPKFCLELAKNNDIEIEIIKGKDLNKYPPGCSINSNKRILRYNPYHNPVTPIMCGSSGNDCLYDLDTSIKIAKDKLEKELEREKKEGKRRCNLCNTQMMILEPAITILYKVIIEKSKGGILIGLFQSLWTGIALEKFKKEIGKIFNTSHDIINFINELRGADESGNNSTENIIKDATDEAVYCIVKTLFQGAKKGAKSNLIIKRRIKNKIGRSKKKGFIKGLAHKFVRCFLKEVARMIVMMRLNCSDADKCKPKLTYVELLESLFDEAYRLSEEVRRETNKLNPWVIAQRERQREVLKKCKSEGKCQNMSEEELDEIYDEFR